MDPAPDIQDLLSRSRGRLWRGRPDAVTQRPALPTGHAALDTALPDQGWPLGAVIELLLSRPMQRELPLLLPAMARQNQAGRWLALLNPPAIPYAPGLAQAGIDLDRLIQLPGLDNGEAWWALEQLVRHSACGMAVAWVDPPKSSGEGAALRRLQLAAERGGGMAVLCRGLHTAGRPSTAALRLRMNADGSLDILKARGMVRRQQIRLD